MTALGYPSLKRAGDGSMNFGLSVSKSARRSPDAVAAFDERRTLTYAELDESSNRLANYFATEYGLCRGDRVALLVHNRVEVVETLAGTAKGGFIYVGLNFRMSTEALAECLANAAPRLLISESEFTDEAERLGASFGIPIIMLDDNLGYRELTDNSFPEPPGSIHDIALQDVLAIVYTSGTTGPPKGVTFTHEAVLAHALVAALEFDIRADSRYLIVLPHNSSVFLFITPTLVRGAAIGLFESRGFDSERFVRAIEAHQATHTYLVPTMLFRLLEHDDGTYPQRLSSLTTLGYGAAPTPPERVREMVERYGPIMLQLYGMSEVAACACILRKDEHMLALQQPHRLASCGTPSYLLDVRVVDRNGNDLPTGQTGEIVFGGMHVMTGYFGDPVRTAESLVDGWMHSGDLGYFDEDGYLFVVDRVKDLIIRGGHNLAPSDIEKVLYQHPDVLEAAVIGVPDAEWGEAIVALVTVKEGRMIDTDELARMCRESGLSSIMLPTEYQIVQEMPKTALGKIAKRELRDRYWAGPRKV
jgi:acyl-CoA synthetase (AMP-forming)/AMP-acid ligase II